jgi:recombination protein RecT
VADQKSVTRILSMVELCGSKEKKDNLLDNIKRNMPPYIQNKERYAFAFQKVVEFHLASDYCYDKKSIIPCVYQAVKFGLEPDPIFGHIFFIPYKGKLTYQLGYKGMIKLAKNGGNIVDVRGRRILDGDVFEYSETSNGQHFVLTPKMQEHGRNEIGCVSIVELKNGKCFAHPMASDHINEIKKLILSRMKGKMSPWEDPLFEPEMRVKTTLRRHLKTLDCSPEIMTAIEHEETLERGEVPKYTAEEIDAVLDKMEIPEGPDPQTAQDDEMNGYFVKQIEAEGQLQTPNTKRGAV